jgi:hypothetical protein
MPGSSPGMTGEFVSSQRRDRDARSHLSPCGRGRIASSDAIRVRGYGPSIDLNPSPQPSPTRGEGAHRRLRKFSIQFSKSPPVVESSLRAQRSNPSHRAKKENGLLRRSAPRNDGDGAAPHNAVIPRAGGVSSTPRPLDSIISISGILDRPPSRAMTSGK